MYGMYEKMMAMKYYCFFRALVFSLTVVILLLPSVTFTILQQKQITQMIVQTSSLIIL
jgi:heme exporter protein D